VIARPAAGTTREDFERTLFATAGVASVRKAASIADLVEDRVGDFTAILRIAQVAVLVLALLIAFNSASLAAEERTREEATMLAYGLPVRTILRIAVVESGILGLLGTAIGIAGGIGVLGWLLASLHETMPEVGITTSIAPATIAVSLVLGVLAVGAAPLLTARRLVRMDVPSALRTLE
jgi:putative ABC transport system permease protein